MRKTWVVLCAVVCALAWSTTGCDGGGNNNTRNNIGDTDSMSYRNADTSNTNDTNAMHNSRFMGTDTGEYATSARGADAEYAPGGTGYTDPQGAGTSAGGTVGLTHTPGNETAGNGGTMAGGGTQGTRNDNTSTGTPLNSGNTLSNAQEQVSGYNPVQQLAMATGGGFDRSFLEAMMRHHEQGLGMARLAVRSAKHKSLKEFANTMVQQQESELEKMRQWYRQWYPNVQASR